MNCKSGLLTAWCTNTLCGTAHIGHKVFVLPTSLSLTLRQSDQWQPLYPHCVSATIPFATHPVILIVEDEDLVRILVVEYLKEVGFDVVQAIHVAHALSLADQTKRIDAVFTDIHMPGKMDGHALAEWFRQHRPDVPLLLTSGIDNPDIGSSGRHRRFIPKPYELPEVARHIRELLH